MTISEYIAKTDSFIRPVISYINPNLSIRVYSFFRKLFLEQLTMENNFKFIIDENKKIKLWDIEFQSTLFNAAGMFKNGNGYWTAANQGAGAFLAGTSTEFFRKGNIKVGIKHPFAPYPHSYIASNWMGLPNEGHSEIAKKLSEINKIKGCPVGISVSATPEEHWKNSLNGLLKGLFFYEKANVDFIEINESCPNVIHEIELDSSGLDKNLINRIEYINNQFIKKQNKRIPIIVKLSNDTNLQHIENLIELLLLNNISGINFGNTSTNYDLINNYIHSSDWNLYKYFTTTFGGGISGFPLKKMSLDLCKEVSKILSEKNMKNEFHIIRTGGIFNKKDLEISNNYGISLNQWFTGYFENFSKFGHSLYSELFNDN